MTSTAPLPDLAASQDLLTVADLCRWLKVPKATVYDWTHTGVIPHYKLGRLLRFDPREVQAWLNARRVHGRVTRIPDPLSPGISRFQRL